MVWGLLIALILLGVLLERLGHRRRFAQANLARQRALEQIRLLRLLLEQVQRHRGLCFGIMSGEVSLESQRSTAHLNVEELLLSLEDHEATLFWYAPWHAVLPMWRDIEQRLQSDSPEAVLKRHHRLVESLLDTIEAIADKHDLVCLGRLAPQPLGLWLELLKNTELLGRARAVGTGIAARRQNTVLQHDELRKLREQINDRAYLAPVKLNADPELNPHISQAVRAAEDCLDELINGIDSLLANLLEPGMPSNRFFQLASRAIAAQMMLIDMLLDRLPREAQPGSLRLD